MNDFEQLIVDNILEKIKNKNYGIKNFLNPIYYFIFDYNFLGNEINSLLRKYPSSKYEKISDCEVSILSNFNNKKLDKTYKNVNDLIPNFKINVKYDFIINSITITSFDDCLKIEMTEDYFNYFNTLLLLEEKKELDKIIVKKEKKKTKKRL